MTIEIWVTKSEKNLTGHCPQTKKNGWYLTIAHGGRISLPNNQSLKWAALESYIQTVSANCIYIAVYINLTQNSNITKIFNEFNQYKCDQYNCKQFESKEGT